jgi:osmotically-inducible protein OsmY
MKHFHRDIRAVKVVAVGALLAVALANSGCAVMFAGAAVGAGASAGVAANQERTVGNAVDDTTISVKVSDELFQKDPMLTRTIGVDVVEGRVLLTGTVQKSEDRVEATRLTWQVAGVKEVINEVQVTERSGVVGLSKDTWITTQMRSKLLTDGGVDNVNYNVETVNGVIYLIGIAQSQQELEKVTELARNISGVRKVVSHVVMKDSTRRKS